MRANLDKLYPTLRPAERVAMMQAAWMRGDEADAARLGDTAPVRVYTCAEHVWYGTALRQLELAYLIEQLDRLVVFHQAASIESDSPRLEAAARGLAYRIVTAFDGWTVFCTALGYTAPGAIAEIDAYQTLLRSMDLVRALAFTQTEMADWLAAHQQHDVPQTPESFAASYRATLEQLA